MQMNMLTSAQNQRTGSLQKSPTGSRNNVIQERHQDHPLLLLLIQERHQDHPLLLTQEHHQDHPLLLLLLRRKQDQQRIID